jgi:hypothetical protein
LNVDGSLATYPWIVHDPNQSGNPASHFSEVFAFDPLGAAMLQPALAATFGNNGSGAPAGSLKRYRGTWTTEASASSLVASADDWNLLTEAICTNVGPNQFVTIPVDVSINPAGFVNVLQGAAQVDIPGLSPFALPTKPAYRAVLFNLDQTAAQTRILSSISGDTVSWATPLPLGFVPVNTRIESQDRRYTWLLTVRMNGAGDAMTDVVVLFNRSFDPADEILFPATFNVNNQPVAITCPADRLRKGAYVFDADNGWWYRIANAANGSITLDVPAAASSPATGGKAMLLRNVVDVYPIGVK